MLQLSAVLAEYSGLLSLEWLRKTKTARRLQASRRVLEVEDEPEDWYAEVQWRLARVGSGHNRGQIKM